MISRVKESVPSLQLLARDAMQLGLIDNNQERLVSAVVTKLGGIDIGRIYLINENISVWVKS